MKKILTQIITIAIAPKNDLNALFAQTEKILKNANKKPLRLILIDMKPKKAKILASFIYEK